MMVYRLVIFIFGLACLVAAPGRIEAHPHIWVTMTEELVYSPDGSVTGLRQTWTFDDMFSVFVTQGIEQKTRGAFTPEELEPLAKTQVESLKEYAYFTYAKFDGKPQKDAFVDPVDYFLDYDSKETVLTFHFTLPFKVPVTAKSLQLEVYDPEFFTYFNFAKTDPVRLIGAPAQCSVSVEKPHDDNASTTLGFDRSLMTSEANAGMGAAFAKQISVKCL